MDGTAQACNVYWWTAEAATLTDVEAFAGTVLSGTAATMTGTTWEGRALATTDVAVTDSTITGCAAAPSVLEIPTLGEGAMALLVALLVGGGLLVLRRRPVRVS
jgi:hypothetical protein